MPPRRIEQQGVQDPVRSFKFRSQGLLKKANDLRVLGAHVAIFVEGTVDGVYGRLGFKTDPAFMPNWNDLRGTGVLGPNHIDYVGDQEHFTPPAGQSSTHESPVQPGMSPSSVMFAQHQPTQHGSQATQSPEAANEVGDWDGQSPFQAEEITNAIGSSSVRAMPCELPVTPRRQRVSTPPRRQRAFTRSASTPTSHLRRVSAPMFRRRRASTSPLRHQKESTPTFRGREFRDYSSPASEFGPSTGSTYSQIPCTPTPSTPRAQTPTQGLSLRPRMQSNNWFHK
ncbi:hypothetical protein JX265_013713 [Neoarthrinium moseri]|uniref:Uncharacterized protein n=1 Tax=Neoarthrinium moseri TaxID=1658444 RepID=A0A9P9W817_9PEZI|nr:hypothetical protein JX266_012100 [Neoarthrinium moseri]KAI1849016.1 hypothetical protein JX265_013713 [Neoarthrinium moseri]